MGLCGSSQGLVGRPGPMPLSWILGLCLQSLMFTGLRCIAPPLLANSPCVLSGSKFLLFVGDKDTIIMDYDLNLN